MDLVKIEKIEKPKKSLFCQECSRMGEQLRGTQRLLPSHAELPTSIPLRSPEGASFRPSCKTVCQCDLYHCDHPKGRLFAQAANPYASAIYTTAITRRGVSSPKLQTRIPVRFIPLRSPVGALTTSVGPGYHLCGTQRLLPSHAELPTMGIGL